ncbi:hypothetical protein BJY01DRAFT_143718 [Aspergillus pseudoustus]|uniref:Uncharacterized protein n=1 Tax=Aspergillus pseudoustus TaxID=1810923 RepID=A0ABR4KB12_9EURO
MGLDSGHGLDGVMRRRDSHLVFLTFFFALSFFFLFDHLFHVLFAIHYRRSALETRYLASFA